MMDARVLAVIPARGGSKRIPRKNVKPVGGKPLIAHAIADAESAETVDRAIVSTDDETIAETARDHGGTVPFMRPAALAGDESPTGPVLTHALDWFEKRGESFDVVCCLQPTSPLRRAEDVDRALRKLDATDAQSVVSISPYHDPPQWAVREDDQGFLEEVFDPPVLWGENDVRSQDLPTLRHPNGAVLAASVRVWQTHESFYTPATVGYEMPPERSFDVDEPWELPVVDALLRTESGNLDSNE